MFKKRYIFPVLALIAFMAVGCAPTGGESQPDGSESTESEVSEVTTYTVTFNTKGGSGVKKQTIAEGEKVSRPIDPTKGGHAFVDWYTEETYLNAYDFDTPVTSSFTLYAKWELSTARTLVSQVNYYSTDDANVELAMFNETGMKFHNLSGWLGEGLQFNMSWRTIMIVDAQGRLAYGVHCPANGYGTPAEYAYASHEIYGPHGLGYTENPAIVLGPNYNSNSNDYEIVIPEGGFAITGHTAGANAIYAMISGTTDVISSEGADNEVAEARGRAFNKTHGEWSTRTFELDAANARVNVYDLATHVTFSGDYSGAFEGDAATGTYTRTMKLSVGKAIAFAHFDGVFPIPVTTANYTFEGEYGEDKGINVHPELANTLIVNRAGNYTFRLNVKTNTFTISREAITEFKITLIDVIGTTPAYVMVGKDEEFVLPTPTNVPAGYTFLRWIKSNKVEFTSGVFTGEEDVTLYAVYDKAGTTVSYAGVMAGFTIDSDASLSYWSEGTVLHDSGSWIGNGWRFFAVIDAEGRLAYAVMFPPNGYGGPDGGTFMCHEYYKAGNEGYGNNPAIELLPGYGPWEPGGTVHNLFKIKVPTGGFGISAHGQDLVKLVSVLTNNAFPGFDGSNEGEYIAQINSDLVLANNTFSYDSVDNKFYSSLY